MAMTVKYRIKDLLKLYVKKTEELGHYPTAKEINKDSDMPSYMTYLRKIGNAEKIRSQAKLNRKVLNIIKTNKQFCSDCVFDPDCCTKKVKECRKEGELYFEFYPDMQIN